MARQWTCQGCKTVNPRVKQRCPECRRKRPASRAPAHKQALDLPYEEYVKRFGERCGICGAGPSARRRLDRDHWHKGDRAGEPRGLLCHRCNRALPDWVDQRWLWRAIDYLNAPYRRP